MKSITKSDYKFEQLFLSAATDRHRKFVERTLKREYRNKIRFYYRKPFTDEDIFICDLLFKETRSFKLFKVNRRLRWLVKEVE